MKQKSLKKKQKLENLSLINGRIEDPDIIKLKEIEDMIGLRPRNLFGTKDFETFRKNLDQLTQTDLEALAHKVGLFASGSREILKSKLLREFKLVTKGQSGISIQKPVLVLDPSNAKHAEMIAILNDNH